MRLLVKLFVATLLPIVSFSQEKMKISGVIKNYPFDVLFVRGDIPKSEVFFDDTIRVDNGRFYYEKPLNGAVHYTFVVKNMLGKFIVYAANETIDVEVDYNKINELVVKGSKANEDYNKVLSKYQNPKKALALMVNDNELKENLAVPYFLYRYIDFKEYDSAKEVLEKLSSKQRKGVYSDDLFQVLKRAKGNVEGAKAYNFELYDLSGKCYRLSDFKGNYVLLEFSASWCGWCKKEIPYLTEAYEYGKEKGLVVITVNLDTDRVLWEKDSNVPWMTLSDLKAFESETTKGYNVGGIPQIYIINREGRIVSRDLRGDQLVNHIKKLLQ